MNDQPDYVLTLLTGRSTAAGWQPKGTEITVSENTCRGMIKAGQGAPTSEAALEVAKEIKLEKAVAAEEAAAALEAEADAAIAEAAALRAEAEGGGADTVEGGGADTVEGGEADTVEGGGAAAKPAKKGRK